MSQKSVMHVQSCWFADLRACLHGGGGTQQGEVTRLSIQSLIIIWSRLQYRWGDTPHVTSPIWGPPPPCEQALNLCFFAVHVALAVVGSSSWLSLSSHLSLCRFYDSSALPLFLSFHISKSLILTIYTLTLHSRFGSSSPIDPCLMLSSQGETWLTGLSSVIP